MVLTLWASGDEGAPARLTASFVPPTVHAVHDGRCQGPDPGEMAAAPPMILAGASEGRRLYATDPATAEATTKITEKRPIASRLRSKNSIINGSIAENGDSGVYIKTKPPAAPFARRLPSPDDMTAISDLGAALVIALVLGATSPAGAAERQFDQDWDWGVSGSAGRLPQSRPHRLCMVR